MQDLFYECLPDLGLKGSHGLGLSKMFCSILVSRCVVSAVSKTWLTADLETWHASETVQLTWLSRTFPANVARDVTRISLEVCRISANLLNAVLFAMLIIMRCP